MSYFRQPDVLAMFAQLREHTCTVGAKSTPCTVDEPDHLILADPRCRGIIARKRVVRFATGELDDVVEGADLSIDGAEAVKVRFALREGDGAVTAVVVSG